MKKLFLNLFLVAFLVNFTFLDAGRPKVESMVKSDSSLEIAKNVLRLLADKNSGGNGKYPSNQRILGEAKRAEQMVKSELTRSLLRENELKEDFKFQQSSNWNNLFINYTLNKIKKEIESNNGIIVDSQEILPFIRQVIVWLEQEVEHEQNPAVKHSFYEEKFARLRNEIARRMNEIDRLNKNYFKLREDYFKLREDNSEMKKRLEYYIKEYEKAERCIICWITFSVLLIWECLSQKNDSGFNCTHEGLVESNDPAINSNLAGPLNRFGPEELVSA